MNCILLPNAQIQNSIATITDRLQIVHINQVLNADVGACIKIGEIGGKLGRAVIQSITENAILLKDVQLTEAPPAKLDLTVVLALPRPKVLRRLIMDMTAMGVRDIILVNSYRSQKSYWQSPMLKRLDEFVLEGLQQGVDTIAPSITLKPRFKPFIEDEFTALAARKAIVAHPYANVSLKDYLQNQGDAFQRELPNVVFIGAEGGWIDFEIELLAAHSCQPVSLGSRILRTEAAVNAILGQWLLYLDS